VSTQESGTRLAAASPAGVTQFLGRFESRRATVAVIGLGYVGLPLVLGFHANGFTLLGIDVDAAKVAALNEGRSYIRHISSDRLAPLTRERFKATTNFSALATADAILICVPTPLTKHLEPDMSFVISTVENAAPHLRKGQLVVLESTTYPGTTRELVEPLLVRKSGLEVNKDFFVAFSPEREDPGNQEFESSAIPKIVGAATPDGVAMASALYRGLGTRVVAVRSPETAEAVKLTENIFRAVNIAMVNELKLIYEAMGIDIWEVIDAASTKPFGFMPFYPGPGLGGHCIPIDPFYLTWKAREFGMTTRFIELAGQINRNMPTHVVRRLAEALSDRRRQALKAAKILLLGIAYKKNVDDMRESPSLVLIELLEARGASVDYHDPYIARIPVTREHGNLSGRQSVALNAGAVAGYDAVLIATDHDDVDYGLVVKNAALVVDTRNVCARVGLAGPNIVKA
jgi:UDP-N-acetyl-D-glucosamine dehydrogenase